MHNEMILDSNPYYESFAWKVGTDHQIEVRALRHTGHQGWATPPIWTDEIDYSGQLGNGDMAVWDEITGELDGDEDPDDAENAARKLLDTLTTTRDEDERERGKRQLRRALDALMAGEDHLDDIPRWEPGEAGLNAELFTWDYGDERDVDLDDIGATSHEKTTAQAWVAFNQRCPVSSCPTPPEQTTD